MEVHDNNNAAMAAETGDWWRRRGTQVQPGRILIAFISYKSVIDAVTSSRGDGVSWDVRYPLTFQACHVEKARRTDIQKIHFPFFIYRGGVTVMPYIGCDL